MDILTSLAIVALAALIHASFQLSVSVLTLLSGHALGANKARRRVVRMSASYIGGAATMTLLLISFVSLLFLHAVNAVDSLTAWAIAAGTAFGFGVAVWLFYYRRGRPGTELWVPRGLAAHLSNRSKATHDSAEAFSLGLSSGVAELLFAVPSLVLSAMVLVSLPSEWQLAGIALYTVLSLGGLVVVWALLRSGLTIGRIQKWREENKHFLQFASGSALIVLGFFVYVSKVVATVAGAL